MLLDASAIVAILAREAGADELVRRMTEASVPLFVSSVTIFEATLGLARAKRQAGRAGGPKPTGTEIHRAAQVVLAFLSAHRVQERVVDAPIALAAIEAAATYGKAVGHAADLNFGDCLVYASAKALNVPLLYVGNDFARTDLA